MIKELTSPEIIHQLRVSARHLQDKLGQYIMNIEYQENDVPPTAIGNFLVCSDIGHTQLHHAHQLIVP